MNSTQPDILKQLNHYAKTQPHKTAFAVVGGINESIDYQTLAIKTDQVAAALQQQYSPGDRVMLIYPNNLEFVISLLACFKVGLIAVPTAQPSFNRKRLSTSILALAQLADSVEPVAILTSNKIQSILSQTIGNPKTNTIDQSLIKTCLAHITTFTLDQLTLQSAQKPKPIKPQPIAFIQFSSGSTGQPKGVIIEYSNLTSNAICYGTGFTENDVTVTWVPLYHDLGMMNGILSPLHFGLTSILMQPMDFAANPAQWLLLISEQKSVFTAAPNFALDHCVKKITPEQMATINLKSLKGIILGAEKNHPKSFNRFINKFNPQGLKASALIPCYGLAETTTAASTSYRHPLTILHVNRSELALGEVVISDRKQPDSVGLISIGKAIPEHELMIMDTNTQQPLPEKKVGEIWFHGPSVSPGYWNNPKATAATFVQFKNKRYLRTGDKGFIYQDQVFIVGRIKTLIIHRGRNIAASDIEWIVQQANPMIKSSGVCAIDMQNHATDNLLLLIECRRHQKQPLSTLLQDIRRQVSLHFSIRVHTIVLLPEASLQKTTSGKLQHFKNFETFQKNQFKPLVIETAHELQIPSEAKQWQKYFTAIE